MSLIKKRDGKNSLPDRARRNILIFKSNAATVAKSASPDAVAKFSCEVVPISPAISPARADASGTAGLDKKAFINTKL